jgi:hypothetical protein
LNFLGTEISCNNLRNRSRKQGARQRECFR